MINTEIKTIQHLSHRYPTVGDYYQDSNKKKLCIRVSDMGNEKYEFLVSIHEQIEEFLTRTRGVTEEVITNFDLKFEQDRIEGNYDEPGDDITAPYYKEHQFATIIEKLLANELGIDWREYEETIIRLDEPSNTGC